VIIVGVGMSGSSCAHKLGSIGYNVFLLERRKYIGVKNIWGGAYYGGPLPESSNEQWSDAPFERIIVKHTYSFMHDNQDFSFCYESRDKKYQDHKSFASWDRPLDTPGDMVHL
jgi:electron transfer flavoprotein-quinone oxidoreductase